MVYAGADYWLYRSEASSVSPITSIDFGQDLNSVLDYYFSER